MMYPMISGVDRSWRAPMQFWKKAKEELRKRKVEV